jgi:hypothetical protein
VRYHALAGDLGSAAEAVEFAFVNLGRLAVFILRRTAPLNTLIVRLSLACASVVVLVRVVALQHGSGWTARAVALARGSSADILFNRVVVRRLDSFGTRARVFLSFATARATLGTNGQRSWCCIFVISDGRRHVLIDRRRGRGSVDILRTRLGGTVDRCGSIVCCARKLGDVLCRRHVDLFWYEYEGKWMWRWDAAMRGVMCERWA